MKKSLIIGDEEDRCFLCGRVGKMQVHHMVHGTANRKWSDKYCLIVHLCPQCHMYLHDRGSRDHDLKVLAQKEFERSYGHDRWMQVFGKNFRDDRKD